MKNNSKTYKDDICPCYVCKKPTHKANTVWGKCFETFCSEQCRKIYESLSQTRRNAGRF